MVKTFNENFRGNSRGNSSRGGSYSNRGGNNQRGGRYDQGPPGYIIPYCTFEHPCQQQIVLKVTDLKRVPKFNRSVYLQNKAKIGSIDEIFGSITGYFFTAKLDEGIKASSFKKGQVLYMNPQDLLPLDRFTQKSKPSGPRMGGQVGRGGPQRGPPRGGLRGGPRGVSRGGQGGNRGFRGRPQ